MSYKPYKVPSLPRNFADALDVLARACDPSSPHDPWRLAHAQRGLTSWAYSAINRAAESDDPMRRKRLAHAAVTILASERGLAVTLTHGDRFRWRLRLAEVLASDTPPQNARQLATLLHGDMDWSGPVLEAALGPLPPAPPIQRCR